MGEGRGPEPPGGEGGFQVANSGSNFRSESRQINVVATIISGVIMMPRFIPVIALLVVAYRSMAGADDQDMAEERAAQAIKNWVASWRKTSCREANSGTAG